MLLRVWPLARVRLLESTSETNSPVASTMYVRVVLAGNVTLLWLVVSSFRLAK